MKGRNVKLVFSALWIAGIAAAVIWWMDSGLEFAEIPERLHAWLSHFGLFRAALIYIVLYTVRPLLLFPATILTVSSGLVFGPWLGILFTIIGENASANFAFFIARWLGHGWFTDLEGGRLKNWDAKLSENAITTVLIMRLVYLPFDAVNYGCGMTSMRQRDFFVGTFLGIMPGLVTFVFLGGAGAAGVENRMLLFGTALVFFVVGLAAARVLRKDTPQED